MSEVEKIAHLKKEIGDELFGILLDSGNTGKVRGFLQSLRDAEKVLLLPVPVKDDEEAVRLLVEAGRYTEKKAKKVVATWRAIATEHGYAGPILWIVQGGFLLKRDAPANGPCYDKFDYLRNWSFEDTPTAKSLVFWIPCLLKGSTSKTADQQLAFLTEERKRLALPGHHLKSFGSVALVSALILAHFKRTGERTPLNNDWVRTDTRDADGYRLLLHWYAGELGCGGRWDGLAVGYLGAFALGVEILGS